MPSLSPRLELPYLEPSQAQKHVTHNEALRRLDMLVQLSVQGFDENTPPALPVTGHIYALGAAPTDAWAGQADMLALREDNGWSFVAPDPGWMATLAGDPSPRIWTGAAWAPITGATQNLDGLGVNTSSDATNRLAVAAGATLLSHDGADHRLVINKASATDTGSVLFQSNWTGHAEMGLAGDTGFSVKVSPDGMAWHEALSLTADGQSVSGTLVQSDPSDQASGKLLKTGAFGLGGEALTLGNMDNLDDLTASGFYYNPTSTNTPGNNYPVSSAGALTVVYQSEIRCVQYYTVYGSSGTRTFTRSRHSGGWAGWHLVFDQNTILGSVSHANGHPTGAIIERGSNASGAYVRFADGTQICTKNFSLTGQDVNTAYGSFGQYRSSNLMSGQAALPASFAGTAATDVTYTLQAYVADYSVGSVIGGNGDINNFPSTLYVVSPVPLTGRTIYVRCMAIGRWF